MIPLKITLSDRLRDALEKAINDICAKDYDLADEEKEIARIIPDILFNTNHPDPAVREEAYQLSDALISMTSATGSPAIYFENLPDKHGKRFAKGLMHFLCPPDGVVSNKVIQNRLDQNLTLHQDRPYYPIFGKPIRLLYCDNPGNRPTPTIFASIDEGIESMIDIRAKKLPSTDIDIIRSQVINDLKSVSVHPTYRGQRSEPEPLLHENPHYKPNNPQGPQYFLCMPNLHDSGRFLNDAIPDSAHREKYQEFRTAINSLMPAINQSSVVGTEPNTFVIWNDAVIQHERGLLREELTPYLGQRIISSFGAVIDHEKPVASSGPAAIASGAWVERIGDQGKFQTLIGQRFV